VLVVAAEGGAGAGEEDRDARRHRRPLSRAQRLSQRRSIGAFVAVIIDTSMLDAVKGGEASRAREQGGQVVFLVVQKRFVVVAAGEVGNSPPDTVIHLGDWPRAAAITSPR